MLFENSPFNILNTVFKNLYPNKRYRAFFDFEMKDENGEQVFGATQFNEDDVPYIFIDVGLSIKDAIEIFAHELAHVAVGIDNGHGKEWEIAFFDIQEEYNKLGEKLQNG